jgi:hypothetical protein
MVDLPGSHKDMRNFARLAKLPAWSRDPITTWTAAEARAFLDGAKQDPLYPAFVFLLLYGLPSRRSSRAPLA